MKNFKEVYELGTDAYTKHTKKMTPGQNEGYEGEVTKILKKKGINSDECYSKSCKVYRMLTPVYFFIKKIYCIVRKVNSAINT